MTRIESDKAEVKNSSEKVYAFFCNMNNLEQLMPEQVVKWNSTEKQCSFTIQGTGIMEMEIHEKFLNKKISYSSFGKSPIKFTLECLIDIKSENRCEVQLAFNAEMNMMLEMLAKKPLQNFVNMLVNKLAELEITR